MADSAPQPEEVEVSLFGPGYGESVVIHLGNNEWMIVDSCRLFGESPAALGYLNRIGVDPERVRLIVASHWHDDHIKGLTTILEACPNALFACSSALAQEEFCALVEQYDRPVSRLGSGADEFRKILHRLDGRPRRWVGEGTQLWRRRETPNASVWSLSPTSDTFTLAMKALAAQAASGGQTKTRLTSDQLPNQVCVVLWISIGACDILLGGDLEDDEQAGQGWSAIVSQAPPWDSPASVFKVPHHGSRSGHNDAVWSQMLGSDPYALVTPFTKLARPLPTNEDRSRIRAATPNSFITVAEAPVRTVQRSRSVQKFLRKRGRQPVVTLSSGQVRLRALASDADWTVETIPPAGPL